MIFKAYTLPILILIIGLSLYYFSFHSVKEYFSQKSTNENSTIEIVKNISPVQNEQSQILQQNKSNPIQKQQIPTPGEEEKYASTTKETKQYYAITNNANIREYPLLTSKVIGKLSFGESVNIVKIKEGWAQIESGGFVAYRLLSEKQVQKTLFVAIPTVNVREYPSKNAKIIATLHQKEKVNIVKIKEGWAQIESGGFVAYSLLKENL